MVIEFGEAGLVALVGLLLLHIWSILRCGWLNMVRNHCVEIQLGCFLKVSVCMEPLSC